MLLIGDRRIENYHELLATRCDELLSELNCEYKSKRASGRLGQVRFMDLSTKKFAEEFAGKDHWETQFKLLPLTLHTLISKDIRRVS